MKPVMLVLGALVVLFLMGAGMTALIGFRAGDYTDTFNVTTDNATTTSDCTLSQDVLDDQKAYISISSNSTDDAPVPSSYNSGTEVLTVGGLHASTQRMLTVTYKYPLLSSTTYWGADLAARALPLVLILGVIGVIFGAVYTAARGQN